MSGKISKNQALLQRRVLFRHLSHLRQLSKNSLEVHISERLWLSNFATYHIWLVIEIKPIKSSELEVAKLYYPWRNCTIIGGLGKRNF